MIKSEDSAENNFLTKKKFSKMVEAATVHELNLNYIDAIVHLAEKNNMELEDINKFVTPQIKQRLNLKVNN